MQRLVLVLALVGALAGCGLSREARVRQKLVDAGVRPEMAACMAGKLVRKLDDDELRQLGKAAKLPGQNLDHMRFGAVEERLAALGDPHIVSVVTRVSLGCAIAG